MSNWSKPITALLGATGGGVIVLTILVASQAGIAGWIVTAILAALAGAAALQTYLHRYTLSITDDTTGLYNRRYLFTRLARELRQARRTGEPLVFVVLEIDNMKQCNDTHGHLAGDDLLLAVGNTLRAGIRQSDVVVRWGGDEFAIILPRTNVTEALVMAERMRNCIAALSVPTSTGGQARSTASVGVAISLHQGSVRELIDRADQAMYLAKRQKNSVMLAV